MSNRSDAWGEHRERFYRSVAETLALLHADTDRDRVQAMSEVASVLVDTMGLPLAWIGRVEPGDNELTVLASAGRSAGYTKELHVCLDQDGPQARGPVPLALCEFRPQISVIDSPEAAPWRALAKRYGLMSTVAAATSTQDGGRLSLSVYASDQTWSDAGEMVEWAQRLVEELARFWDHQSLIERAQRVQRFRDAQRRIQRALLDQPDPEAVYRTLAEALVAVAGVAAVDVLVADMSMPLLRRAALCGRLADEVRHLPPPTRKRPENGLVTTPTQAIVNGKPEVHVHPADRSGASEAWRLPGLREVGALGSWPVFVASHDVPTAVFAVFADETDAFDAEMRTLFDEIAEATGLALRQHEQRRALAHERERQTYFALHDPLTELPNRRALEQYLDEAIRHAEQNGRMFAVGLLDLDDFKPINDRYGHAVGDRVLMHVAHQLRQALRSTDYLARFGGDEFVLVLEALESEQELDIQLMHVWRALRLPIAIDSLEFELSASLGVSLYPTHAEGSGEQLLRRADQAMYQVKAQKRHRTQWWSLPPDGDSGEPPAGADVEHAVSPYGTRAAELLGPWQASFQAQVPALIDEFFADLQRRDASAHLLDSLPEGDSRRLHDILSGRLRRLLRPRMSATLQRRQARLLGQLFAACGVEEVLLLEAVERLRDFVAMALGAATHRDRRPLSIILQRLAMERQWQIESMRELQRQRMALLATINALAWSANTYLELIQRVVDILVSHPEINACAVGRPDADGFLTYEAVGGRPFRRYLEAMDVGRAAPIRVTSGTREGVGPSGRAWRSLGIERSTHYGSDPLMATWAQFVLTLGIRSNVALPLCRSPRTPVAVLTIYSPYPGGLQSDDQQSFLEQIKSVLDLALARLSPLRPGAQLVPFLVRDRWRRRLLTPALKMVYQPVVRLRGDGAAELEALARLEDDDGSLLLPGRFMPALSDDDLVMLFGQAMAQATSCRQWLLEAGHALDVAVNVPASALRDPAYVELAASVLEASPCPPGAVLLEILESPIGMDDISSDVVNDSRAQENLRALKALGLRLVEDDLGSGYSSLIRLRQWPFDRVKIDQAIARQVIDQPMSTLRFMRQLIRLGHDLELEVVVEGLETEGMVEAALVLGADMGQGFALARPMLQADLPAWFDGFRLRWEAEAPHTALGALASALVWEERLFALAGEPEMWARYARASCGVGAYLRHHESPAPELVESHRCLHEAAEGGPRHAKFRRTRDRFMQLLVEQALAEERVR